MSRLLAVLRATLLCAALMTATTATAAPKSKLLGRYKCTVTRDGVEPQDPAPCSVVPKRAQDGSGRTLWFGLPRGVVRLSGWVHPKEDGFEVDGAVRWPLGDTEPAQMRFVATASGFDGEVETASGKRLKVRVAR